MVPKDLLNSWYGFNFYSKRVEIAGRVDQINYTIKCLFSAIFNEESNVENTVM